MSMRGIILFCLYSFISRIVAAPEYQYEAQMVDRQPHAQYGVTPTYTADTANGIFTAHASNAEINYRLSTKNPLMSGLETHASYLTPAPFVVNTLQQQAQYQHTFHHHQPPHSFNKPQTIISKRFYLHTAPEDDDDDDETQHYLTVGKTRKNYNIVFIKSPEKSKSKTTLKITPAVNEEKTIIYVLNKKHEAADIEAEVDQPISTTAKPEVYFIKYKTADEAEHAQHTIQAQYDALGGSTEIINEGVGLEGSVIGSLDVGKHTAGQEAVSHEEAHTLATVYAHDEDILQNTVDEQNDDVQLEANMMGSNTYNGYLPPPAKSYRR
ncbi:uncharacterized protein [Eurosta solidaginis]|uniref:uncharacterized protein n=1 Tax=Eurosta solidaginis TaxID=178769 RepID=UPI0035306D03